LLDRRGLAFAHALCSALLQPGHRPRADASRCLLVLKAHEDSKIPRLRPALRLRDIKLHSLVFPQVFMDVLPNRRVMNEDIEPIVSRNKAKTAIQVPGLDGALR
jgi:hypothetical protein